jgi:hypothetical protein
VALTTSTDLIRLSSASAGVPVAAVAELPEFWTGFEQAEAIIKSNKQAVAM